jgi:hypothetical protein
VSRSDEERIADILDACDELAGVVRIRTVGQVPEPVLLRAAERLLAQSPTEPAAATREWTGAASPD